MAAESIPSYGNVWTKILWYIPLWLFFVFISHCPFLFDSGCRFLLKEILVLERPLYWKLLRRTMAIRSWSFQKRLKSGKISLGTTCWISFIRIQRRNVPIFNHPFNSVRWKVLSLLPRNQSKCLNVRLLQIVRFLRVWERSKRYYREIKSFNSSFCFGLHSVTKL